MKRVTIIGGGASGTLLALNLLKYDGEKRLEVNLVEKRSTIGRGVAFSTEQDVHLLNVPAAKMGAFADDVEHFHEWLGSNGLAHEPSAFVPRRIFGEYLRECLETANQNKATNVHLNIFDDEAVDITFDSASEPPAVAGGLTQPHANASVNERAGGATASKAHVRLKSGDILYSEKVALAFGNSLPPHPYVDDQSFTRSANYFQDPWNPNVFETIKTDESVFIIGTGLSMVDVTMQLNKRGHAGPITAISTRGLLPAVHKLGFTYPVFNEEILGATRITEVLKTVRRHAAKAQADGSDWRAVIDNLRPVTQRLWLDLPLAEKKYFMQHLSRYWNVARHRMPPEAAVVLDELRGIGQLQILKGRLEKITVNQAGSFDIEYRTIGVEQHATADVIVNCVGSESKFDQLDSPLVQSLLKTGHIRCDDLRFGLDATPDGVLKDANGETGDLLYTLGTALKGILWESTAIPEIRVQARDLARKLFSE